MTTDRQKILWSGGDLLGSNSKNSDSEKEDKDIEDMYTCVDGNLGWPGGDQILN